LERKAIKKTRINAEGQEEVYEDRDAEIAEEESKRFARKLLKDRISADYL